MVFKAKCDRDLSFYEGFPLPGVVGVDVRFSALWAHSISPSLLGSFSFYVSTIFAFFSVASSLYLTLESLFWQSSGHFLVYLHCNGCYVVGSMRWSELRIFLLSCLLVCLLLLLFFVCLFLNRGNQSLVLPNYRY